MNIESTAITIVHAAPQRNLAFLVDADASDFVPFSAL